MKKNLSQLWSLQTLLYLALILALFASLGHVAYAFSTVNGSNWIEAYISAIAIDLGLLALAAGINKRTKQGRSTKPLWGGVILFSLISIYANWLAGIGHIATLDPGDTDPGSIGNWLISLRPILLSGVLPILVIYLSEIVSGNYHQDIAEAERQKAKEAKKAPIRPNEPALIPPMDQSEDEREANLAIANQARKSQADEKRVLVAGLLADGKGPKLISEETGIPYGTVKGYIAKIKNEPVIEPVGLNGNGNGAY